MNTETPENNTTEQNNNNLEENKDDTVVKTLEIPNVGEVVAKLIIEKIIGLAVKKTYIENVEKKINDHCFDFLKKSLKPLISQIFICYDKEKTEQELKELDEAKKKIIQNNKNNISDTCTENNKNKSNLQKSKNSNNSKPKDKFKYTKKPTKKINVNNQKISNSINIENKIEIPDKTKNISSIIDNNNLDSEFENIGLINQNNKETFFDNHFDDNFYNTWTEIIEPFVQPKDRNAGGQITVHKYIEDKDSKLTKNSANTLNEMIQKELKIKQATFTPIEDLDEDKKIIECPPKKLSSNLIVNNINKKKIKISAKGNKNQTKISQKKEEDTEVTEPEPAEVPIINLPSYDLPEELFAVNSKLDNSPEADELRREWEYNVKVKEQEKKYEEEKAKRELMYARAMKHRKDFDGSKYTFDSNGKIVQIKPISIENLAKEFFYKKPVIKQGGIKKGMYKQEKIVKELSTSPSNLSNSLSAKTNKRKPSVTINEDIIYNKQDVKDALLGPTKKNIGLQIATSGENFSLIRPEVGVVITNEDQNIKDGGNEFYKKFKKPSMFEFSQMVLQSQKLNSQKFLSSNFSSLDDNSNNNYSTLDNVDNKNSYIGYKQQFSKENNPLIQGNISNNISSNDLKIKKRNIKKLKLPSLYNSCNTEGNYNSSRFNTIMSDKMYLSKCDMPNLQNIFHDEYNNKPVEEDEFSYITKKANQKRNKIILNPLDNFNNKILQTENWGENYGSGRTKKIGKRFKKPNAETNIQELGLRIATTKMPRDRKLIRNYYSQMS